MDEAGLVHFAVHRLDMRLQEDEDETALALVTLPPSLGGSGDYDGCGGIQFRTGVLSM